MGKTSLINLIKNEIENIRKMQQNVHQYNKYRTASVQEHEKLHYAEARKITARIAEIALKKYNATNYDLRLSDYALENQYEWFAETFAEANLHTTNKPLVQAMKDFLNEEGM